jgi:hypothetical protein
MLSLNDLKRWIFAKLFWGVMRHVVTDMQYAQIRYRLEQDQPLNLKCPSRFTEKIQWIKLYDRTELRKKAADRLRVRHYVSDRIGENHLVPLHTVFDKLTPDIWESLPGQFVLKANHGCGMVQIVGDKTDANYSGIEQIAKRWMATDYFTIGREWVYKGLKRTTLAEKLLLDENGQIPSDYKFFCFQGQVEIIQVDFNRFGNQKRNLYDRNFNRVEGQLLYPNFEDDVSKPEGLDRAVEIAEALSKEFSFIRVDLYIVNKHVYFGELTNYPGNGFIEFRPESLELRLGSLLQLPKS